MYRVIETNVSEADLLALFDFSHKNEMFQQNMKFRYWGKEKNLTK